MRLSREHALFSALTYVFTHALDDYIAPLAEMVWALTHLGRDEAQEQAQGWLAYKVLAYLRCSLRGRQFPPGAIAAQHVGICEVSGTLDACRAGLAMVRPAPIVLMSAMTSGAPI